MESLKELNIDIIEEKVKKIYFPIFGIIFFVIIVAISIIPAVIFYENASLLFFLIAILVGLYVPNFIVLNNTICPYCQKKYFKRKLITKGEFKTLIREAQSCICCGNKALIISKHL